MSDNNQMDLFSGLSGSFEKKLDVLLTKDSSKEEITDALGGLLEDIGIVINQEEQEGLPGIDKLDMDNLPDIETLQSRMDSLQSLESQAVSGELVLSEKQKGFCNLLDMASARLVTMPHPLAKVAAVACNVAKMFITPRNVELELVIKEQIDTYNGILSQQLDKLEQSNVALHTKIQDVAQNIGNRHADTSNIMTSSIDEIKRDSENSINNLISELDNF